MSPKPLGRAGPGSKDDSVCPVPTTGHRAGRHNHRSTTLIKGFVHRQKKKGPALKDHRHRHRRIGLFRQVLFGSSKIRKEILVSFRSPGESPSPQRTSKARERYQKIPMPALLISRLTCNASTAILGVTNHFILSVIDSRGKQKRGFWFVLTNPLQGTTLRCQRLLCIYNAGDTHNSEVS